MKYLFPKYYPPELKPGKNDKKYLSIPAIIISPSPLSPPAKGGEVSFRMGTSQDLVSMALVTL